MNVLLLEPDKLLADTYRRALQTEGHRVTMCATAQAAIFAADEYRPDIVITELQLVKHSGIEFLYEFRSYHDWDTVPIVVLTSVPPGELHAHHPHLQQQLGVQHCLYKPQTDLVSLQRLLGHLVPNTAKS